MLGLHGCFTAIIFILITICYFFLILYCFGTVLVTPKLTGLCTDFHILGASSSTNITHQSGTFFKNEPTSTQHDHPRSPVDLIVYSWCPFYGFGQCITTYIHLDNIIQSILKIYSKSPMLYLFLFPPLTHSNH